MRPPSAAARSQRGGSLPRSTLSASCKGRCASPAAMGLRPTLDRTSPVCYVPIMGARGLSGSARVAASALPRESPHRPLRGSVPRCDVVAAHGSPTPDALRFPRLLARRALSPGAGFYLGCGRRPGSRPLRLQNLTFCAIAPLRRVVAPGRRDYAKREFCIIADLSDRGCFFCGSLPSLFSASPLDFLADVW